MINGLLSQKNYLKQINYEMLAYKTTKGTVLGPIKV